MLASRGKEGNPFSVELQHNRARVGASLDDYFKKRAHASSNSAASVKAAPVITPMVSIRSLMEEQDDAERELLGLPPLSRDTKIDEIVKPICGTSRSAPADGCEREKCGWPSRPVKTGFVDSITPTATNSSRTQGEEEKEAEAELLGAQLHSSKSVVDKQAERTITSVARSNPGEALACLDDSITSIASSIAEPGTLLKTSRSCPEGHPVRCYVIAPGPRGSSGPAAFCGICDECETLQRPGSIVFGCSICDCELCASCAVELSTSTEARGETNTLIARCRALKPCDSSPSPSHPSQSSDSRRFVATPQGEVLDTGPALVVTDGKVRAAVQSCVNAPADRVHAPEQRTGAGAVVCSSGIRDMLASRLAEQELVIQRRRLARQEAHERQQHLRQHHQQYQNGFGLVSASGRRGARNNPQASEEINLDQMDEDAARVRPAWAANGETQLEPSTTQELMEQTCELTLALASDLADELIRGFSQPWYQTLAKEASKSADSDRTAYIEQLQNLAFEVQKPILENWGFEGNSQGVYDMTCTLRQQIGPTWMRRKLETCFSLLYGESGLGQCAEDADSQRI